MAANVALTQHVLKSHRMVVSMENVCVEERMNARRDLRVEKGHVVVRSNISSDISNLNLNYHENTRKT